jgi:hypothetical protein
MDAELRSATDGSREEESDGGREVGFEQRRVGGWDVRDWKRWVFMVIFSRIISRLSVC